MVLGLGCRRNAAYEAVRTGALNCLEGYRTEALCCLASIDLKAEEPAFLALSRNWNIPFQTWPASRLMALSGSFSSSAFVMEKTGADNVCERSAAVSACGGVFLRRRTVTGPVTAALALKNRRISFEKEPDHRGRNRSRRAGGDDASGQGGS